MVVRSRRWCFMVHTPPPAGLATEQEYTDTVATDAASRVYVLVVLVLIGGMRLCNVHVLIVTLVIGDI